jgi:hypothetical protein
MFHSFEEEDVGKDHLICSTDFKFSSPGNERAVYSFLTSVKQTCYRKKGGVFVGRSLPPVEFEYSQPELVESLIRIDNSTLENVPAGLVGQHVQLIDLYGEGVSGILTTTADGTAWFYNRNESPLNLDMTQKISTTTVSFSALDFVTRKPNMPPKEEPRFVDLNGDGVLSVLEEDSTLSGFFKADGTDGWKSFQPFLSRPITSLKNEHVKMVDLTGDGLADLFDEMEGHWYQSLGEAGFQAPTDMQYAINEESGPVNIFSDTTDGVYLADLSGDGLSDIVRIRNGEVCYWPSLGYGKFGSKVPMDNSPWFDSKEEFDPKRIVLADIDGSGTTDLMYLRRDGLRCFFNESGNGWSPSVPLNSFPPTVNGITAVQAVDLLGNGTSCLVFSNPLPPSDPYGMSYLPLMASQKPHLLKKISNNMGATTTLSYAPSTKFYLQDKREGRPWLTRLPFPVQCLDTVIVEDHIAKTRMATTFEYHHGFYDGFEREFRGFGMVEQRDRERVFATADNDDNPTTDGTDLPTMLTKIWFHQGMWLNTDAVSLHFENEYFRHSQTAAEGKAWLLPDTLCPIL